ncbi:TPA: hypothetical protein ACXJE6_008066, partial [Burkholderia contaminans]
HERKHVGEKENSDQPAQHRRHSSSSLKWFTSFNRAGRIAGYFMPSVDRAGGLPSWRGPSPPSS